MPRFTLKTLFLSMTLIAVGVYIIAVNIAEPFNVPPVWILGWAMIGGGLLLPLNRVFLGAVIGVLLSLAWLASIFVPEL